MSEHKQKILNVPNVLTIIRMLLIPVYWLIFNFSVPAEGTYNFHLSALIVFIVASITDILDGRIARRYNLITDFGKLMDPLADKLMVISVMISLALYIREQLFWIALGLILLKELCMVVGGLLMLRRKIVVYSIWIGKAAQAVIVCALISSFFSDYFVSVGIPVYMFFIWTGVLLTYCAGAVYLKKAIGGFHNA